jgi:hypothetical protein
MITAPDIAWVLRTVDRRPRGATNYLTDTLRRLRAVSPDAPGVTTLYLVDSGSPDPGWLVEAIRAVEPSTTFDDAGHVDDTDARALAADDPQLAHLSILPVYHYRALTNNENAIEALTVGLAANRPWIVHLEDDVDVIDGFFDGVAAWLTDHALPATPYLLYTFHTPYAAVRHTVALGQTSWRYPIPRFYGNQCWAIRRDAAERLLAYLRVHVPTWSSGQGFDLLIKKWATAEGETHFLASAPSFVQHVGVESSLHLGRFHQNSSFPGRQWRYVRTER